MPSGRPGNRFESTFDTSIDKNAWSVGTNRTQPRIPWPYFRCGNVTLFMTTDLRSTKVSEAAFRYKYRGWIRNRPKSSDRISKNSQAPIYSAHSRVFRFRSGKNITRVTWNDRETHAPRRGWPTFRAKPRSLSRAPSPASYVTCCANHLRIFAWKRAKPKGETRNAVRIGVATIVFRIEEKIPRVSSRVRLLVLLNNATRRDVSRCRDPWNAPATSSGKSNALMKFPEIRFTRFPPYRTPLTDI